MRLADYLADALHRPFAWGSHDCALWAAAWVRLATGADHVSDWIGTYSTAAGAFRQMRLRGFDGVEGIAARHLPEKPVREAGRGDLMLHPSGALGICNGLASYFVTEGGLIAEPTLACRKAWGVA